MSPVPKLYLFLLTIALLAGSGCIYVPTPKYGLLSGRAMVTDEVIKELVPAHTSRADVLLKLGDPSRRLENDGIFIYHWERIQGEFWFYGGGTA